MSSVKLVLRQNSPSEDRRSEVRFATNDPAAITILQPGNPTHVDGRILDISKSGLRLRLSVALQVGQLIQVRVKGFIALAEVRYCRAISESFDVGTRILDALPIKGKSITESMARGRKEDPCRVDLAK